MTAAAHKAATRSDHKSKSENRAAFKRSAWNHMPADAKGTQKAPPASWWVVGAGPSERDQFIAASKQRAQQRNWTNVAPHTDNPSGGYR